jgi:hypothetical protein
MKYAPLFELIFKNMLTIAENWMQVTEGQLGLHLHRSQLLNNIMIKRARFWYAI